MVRVNKSVYGIGVNDKEYPSWNINKPLKEYAIWKDMLLRCTKEFWNKHPTYIGNTCSENFKFYSFFYRWCQEQIGFGNIDENGKSWHLDKDLLLKGNKHYSEDACVFVPSRINSLLVKRNADRGVFPLGVSYHKHSKKFRSRCGTGNPLQQHIGYSDTPEEAFAMYKTFKEAYIKKVADEYKHHLDVRAYEALMSYEVHEND